MYFSTDIIADLTRYATEHGLPESSIKEGFPDLTSTKYVGYDLVIEGLNRLNNQLPDDCLGLHIGEQISLKVTASVNQIMLNSQTLEASIKNAIEYSKVISDALECSFRKTDDHFAIIYEESPNWRVQQQYARQQILDLTLLCNVKSLDAYTNYQYYPVHVSFSTPKPKNLREYYRLFNCSLRFNQPKTEVVYERQIIDRHSRNIQPRLLENLKEKTAKEIANLPNEHPLIREVKKCILGHKPDRLSIRQASDQLHLSSRSLQRKLMALDTTFKAIEYELQLKLSKTYLEEQQKSIDEISYLLGFSESSAFIRFFKSLTAQTPRAYQNTVVR